MSQANQLTEEQLKEFKDAFSHFDINGDGVISKEEFGNVVRMLGQNPTEEELKQVIEEFDEDENGVIDFNEFIKLVSVIPFTDKADQHDELMHAFQVFDKDGNGYISTDELKYAMKNLGEMMTDEQVAEMFTQADINQDGKINYAEFVELMTGDPC
ncbi:calmodulin-like [Diadema setosum]|uniref:calmodulin-like n=1 Tax=Diadema setosum TaxID=31175 RepID=UPI003B3BA1D8